MLPPSLMLLSLLSLPEAAAAGRVSIEAGWHEPFYPPSPAQQAVWVEAFRMDSLPVTTGQLAAFLEANPRWQRGAVPAVFADESYLSGWVGGADPGLLRRDTPATSVSWFAARAYCQAAGGDLPTVFQWEYAADATATAPTGGREDPTVLARILAWYGEGPGDSLRAVGQGEPSYWGLHDMHGLTWEWTLDFSSQLISADVREASGGEELRFCGAGALSARDPEDYASFMRFAMRSALKASSTTDNLGFRCASSL